MCCVISLLVSDAELASIRKIDDNTANCVLSQKQNFQFSGQKNGFWNREARYFDFWLSDPLLWLRTQVDARNMDEFLRVRVTCTERCQKFSVKGLLTLTESDSTNK